MLEEKKTEWLLTYRRMLEMPEDSSMRFVATLLRRETLPKDASVAEKQAK